MAFWRDAVIVHFSVIMNECYVGRCTCRYEFQECSSQRCGLECVADISRLAIPQCSFVQQCGTRAFCHSVMCTPYIACLLKPMSSASVSYHGLTVRQPLSTTHFSVTANFFELCACGTISVAIMKCAGKLYLNL